MRYPVSEAVASLSEVSLAVMTRSPDEAILIVQSTCVMTDCTQLSGHEVMVDDESRDTSKATIPVSSVIVIVVSVICVLFDLVGAVIVITGDVVSTTTVPSGVSSTITSCTAPLMKVRDDSVRMLPNFSVAESLEALMVMVLFTSSTTKTGLPSIFPSTMIS